MATNAGRDYRHGAVRRRTQFRDPRTGRWVKRGPDGRFLNVKADGKRFKGVRGED